ncbi:MAG: cytochrome c-type biogenesis protein [Gammaproteobacteria bacterium]
MTRAYFLFCLICLLALPGRAYAIENHPPLANPVLESRYEHLTEEIRCLVCQDQNIANSPAPLAADLRYEVRRMLKAGRSNRGIKAYLVHRYGDFVLFKPPLQSDTWVLWFGPFLAVAAGLILVAVLAWQRHRTYRKEHHEALTP